MADTVTALFWAQVRPKWSYYGDLRGATIARVTQRRPRDPEPGCVLVRLDLTLPAGAFVPPVMAAAAEVGQGDYERVPARLEADPP